MKKILLLIAGLQCCILLIARQNVSLKEMEAYLFVFFNDSTHSLFMAFLWLPAMMAILLRLLTVEVQSLVEIQSPNNVVYVIRTFLVGRMALFIYV